MNRTSKFTYNLCKGTLTFLALFSTISVCGQTQNTTVSIHNTKGDTMHSDKSNAISIVSEEITKDQLFITVNQGRVRSSYKQLFYVDSLKNGRVTVSVFMMEKNRQVLVKSKNYIVVTSPQKLAYDKYVRNHGFNLSGYSNKSKIPFSVFKKIDRVGLVSGLDLVNASFYISGGTEFPNPYYTKLSSLVFSDYLLKVLGKVRPGSSLVFDEILVRDSKGNSIKLPDLIVFEIVED